LSAPYSSSPTLRLTVGHSDIRRALLAGLSLSCLLAICLIWGRGYPALAAALAPPVLLCLWSLRREPLRGATLQWQRGCWTLGAGHTRRPVRILPASASLRWVILVTWEELPAGRRGRLWLFADSAPADTLRRLRVRLTLESRRTSARG